jgi:hypothetical protein
MISHAGVPKSGAVAVNAAVRPRTFINLSEAIRAGEQSDPDRADHKTGSSLPRQSLQALSLKGPALSVIGVHGSPSLSALVPAHSYSLWYSAELRPLTSSSLGSPSFIKAAGTIPDLIDDSAQRCAWRESAPSPRSRNSKR